MVSNPPSDASAEVQRYRLALMSRLGLPAALLSEPGISVVPDPERADSGMAVCYQLGAHTVVWCDPAVEARVQPFVASTRAGQADPDAFVLWAEKHEYEFVGSGVMNVRAVNAADAQDPRVVAMDRDVPAHRERILEFLATCEADDIDDADIDVDNLDPLIRCALAGDGPELASFASALPFDVAPDWWDIGVVTHPGRRHQGLGGASVRAVATGIEALGASPLYRYDPENLGSAGVALSAGFVQATTLRAARLS